MKTQTGTNGRDATAIGEVAASPCATCPWRRQNQTRQAVRSSRIGANGKRWYSQANLRRLWGGIRDGEGMLCHATDPNAPEYGGKECKPGHERMCVGALIIVARVYAEANRIVRDKMSLDRKRGGKLPKQLTKRGYLQWAERMMFRGTKLGMSREQMPVVFDADAACDVMVPWDDVLLNDA